MQARITAYSATLGERRGSKWTNHSEAIRKELCRASKPTNHSEAIREKLVRASKPTNQQPDIRAPSI